MRGIKFTKGLFCHSFGPCVVRSGRLEEEKGEENIFVLEERSVKETFGRGQNKSHFRL